MKVSIMTLGCKINQFDAGVLSEALTAGGAEVVADGQDADVYVIQTCTVTGKSDYQCRQAIRRAVKTGQGGARVVVTGCYAETSPDEILKIPGVDMVVGNSGRDGLPGLLLGGLDDHRKTGLPARIVTGRSRAFLKVQDGCDCGCSYCIVPKARGTSRSASPEDALENARRLADKGFREIVLTGVHLGGYGADLDPKSDLAALTERILGIGGLGRLRMSSIEPLEFSSRMFGLIKEHAREGGSLCRHFHVPLQSGDDRVLDSMGRRYAWSEYLSVMERLDRAAPGSCLGADVIVGYPAEDDESFETTYRRIQDSPVNYLHVFTYSPRPGTRAYDMGDPVPGDVKKQRSARLRELGARKWFEFRRGFRGMALDVVAEEKDGVYTGLTDNYIRVGFNGQPAKSGSVVKVRLKSVSGASCRGEVVWPGL